MKLKRINADGTLEDPIESKTAIIEIYDEDPIEVQQYILQMETLNINFGLSVDRISYFPKCKIMNVTFVNSEMYHRIEWWFEKVDGHFYMKKFCSLYKKFSRPPFPKS